MKDSRDRNPKLLALKCLLSLLYLYPAFKFVKPTALIWMQYHLWGFLFDGALGLMLVLAVLVAWTAVPGWTIIAIACGLLALGFATQAAFVALCLGLVVAVMAHAERSRKLDA